MKVLLLQDIKKIGRKYEIKEVSEGHARNFLIPKKLAVPADRKAAAIKKDFEESEKNTFAGYKDLSDRLSREVLEFNVKTGSKGEVFGSVNAEQIQKTLKDKGYKGIEIRLEKPLRALGENLVGVDFGRGVKGTVKVRLLSQP